MDDNCLKDIKVISVITIFTSKKQKLGQVKRERFKNTLMKVARSVENVLHSVHAILSLACVFLASLLPFLSIQFHQVTL